MGVDTLAIAKDLRAAELSSDQAEAIATAIGRSVSEGSASKADLDHLATILRSDAALLRSELSQDMALLRSELSQESASLRSGLSQAEARIEAKIEALHARLLTWFISAQVAIGALIVALLKL